MIEKKKLEDNPVVLSELLRKRLENINISTSSKVK
jgi:conjugal transfer pilus assembly protein TraF